jgi:hypothetical protein
LSLFAARGNRKTEREKNAKHRNNLTLVQTDPQNAYNTPNKRNKRGPQPHSAEDHRKTSTNRKRAHTQTDPQEPMQDKLFTIITAKVITMMKIRGGRALDELTRPNKGKIRLLSRTEEKKYKGKRNGSRYRAERVGIIHEMTTEEARKEEAKITRTARGRYGNAHIYHV